MIYKWSSETYRPASEAVRRCGRLVGPIIEARFFEGMLGSSTAELFYVPIVMPSEMHDKYAERSRARLKQKRFECAPHLDYHLFASGSQADQVAEYVRGIATSLPDLPRLGLSSDQMLEVRAILQDAKSIADAR